MRSLLIATLLLPGCAYSMISDGALREEPYRDLVAATVEARGLPEPDSMQSRVITGDEVSGLVQRILEQDFEPGALEAYEESLVALGLWPADRDLETVYREVSSEEFAGLYVPEDRTLYVVHDVPVPFSVRMLSTFSRRDLQREIVVTHEIVHALQHHSYPALFDEDWLWHDHDDVAVGISTALEGDASFYGFRAVFPESDIEPEDVRRELGGEVRTRPGGALAEAPALIRLTLAFPYVAGYELAYVEGAELVDDPPISSEQVIHPDLRRADFHVYDLSALAEALPRGCRALSENGVGELLLSVLFRDLGDRVPRTAWEGWDGDRYLAARCGDRREFAWITSWDSEEDASEFMGAYAGIADAVRARAGLEEAPRATRHGREVRVVTSGLAPLTPALGRLPRRGRVASLPELRAFYSPR